MTDEEPMPQWDEQVETARAAMEQAFKTADEMADRIEALVKEVERNAAIAIRAMERATLAEEWSKHDKARAERLEAAIRELRHRWYLGDLQEKDFAAALKGADHE